jgi:hypothetical protein
VNDVARPTTSDKTAVRPFHVSIPEAELVEMRKRIKATRWPERETVIDESQGVKLSMMQDLARYWATDYDWRKVELRLNALQQFNTEIDGLDFHFIHARSKHQNALPLIVTHGWPGSIIERRERFRCFPRGDSVNAGLWFLSQADHPRLGPRAYRARLGHADEAPGI